MPSAVATKKSSVAGTKRKAESSKEAYVKKPKVGTSSSKSPDKKTKKPFVKPAKIQEDSSDDDVDDMDEDGGVPLDDGDDSDDSGTPVPKVKDGVHPDRVKATANGAGPNGMCFWDRLKLPMLTFLRILFSRSSCKAEANGC